jgi:hypothetical protein
MTRDFLSGLRALINRRPRVMYLAVTTHRPLDELCRPIRVADRYEIFSFLFGQWIIANKFSDYGDQDKLHALREQLEIHRNNLNRLEVQRAQYGLVVPLHLDNEIEYVRKEIARLEIEILALEEWE